MNQKIVIIAFLVLLCLVAVSSWMALGVLRQPAFIHVNKPENSDAFAVNANYERVDVQGDVHNKFFVKHLTHYSYNNFASFQQPVITIVNANKADWQITANRGDSKNGAEAVDLIENVKFYQPASANNKETTITTEKAVIFLKQKFAKTDVHVAIKQPGLDVEADGASANFKVGLIKLFANVKETYIPTTGAPANSSIANNDDSNKPAYLQAESAVYDRSLHVTTYIGKINITQGSTFLNADKLIIYDKPENNNIYKVVAFGKPAHYSSIPKGKSDRLNATADRIEYYPDKKMAVLIGNGKITQKDNSFIAPKIIYDLTTETIKTDPAKTTNAKIVITP
jgi:lipopolysaccharide export system protein LptA